jgi:hypothetical protein
MGDPMKNQHLKIREAPGFRSRSSGETIEKGR